MRELKITPSFQFPQPLSESFGEFLMTTKRSHTYLKVFKTFYSEPDSNELVKCVRYE